MTDTVHLDMSSGRWWTMSLAEQFGNIGSEISRARKWSSRRPEISRRALFRALELFDLTLDDPRHRQSPSRLREIARAREVVVDFFDGTNQYGSTATSLQRYFDAYAVYGRMSGGRAYSESNVPASVMMRSMDSRDVPS